MNNIINFTLKDNQYILLRFVYVVIIELSFLSSMYSQLPSEGNSRAAWKMVKIGNNFLNTGRSNEAINYYLMALTIFEQNNDSVELSVTSTQLGYAYRHIEKSDLALNCFKRAILIDEYLNLSNYLPDDYRNIADIYLDLHQFNNAFEYYQKAIKMSKNENNLRCLASCYTEISFLMLNMQNLHRALFFQTKALALYNKTGDLEGISRAYYGLGNIFLFAADNQRALDFYLTANALNFRTKNRGDEAITNYGIGNAYFAIGNYVDAKSYFSEALKSFLDLNIEPSKRNIIGKQLVEIYLKEQKFQLVKDFVINTKEPFYSGRFSLLCGRDKEAVDEFSKAISLYQHENSELTNACYIARGLAFEKLEKFKEANDDFLTVVDRIENERTISFQSSNYFNFVAFGFSRIDAYEGLIRTLYRSNKYQESLFWSEATKSREFCDILNSSAVNSNYSIEDSMHVRENEIFNKFFILKRRKEDAIKKNDEVLLRNIVNESEKLESEQTNLVKILNKENPEFSNSLNSRPFEIENIILEENEVVIEYEVTDLMTLAYIVRKNRVERVIEIHKTRNELKNLVEKFRAPFTEIGRTKQYKPFAQNDIEVGYELYEILLKNALQGIKESDKVVIIPDEILCTLPFEALIVKKPKKIEWEDKGHGRYVKGISFVGDNMVFTYWQSLSSMMTLRNTKKKIQGTKLLLISDPVFNKYDDRLGKKDTINLSERQEKFRSVNEMNLKISNYLNHSFKRLKSTSDFTERLSKIYNDNVCMITGLDANESIIKKQKYNEFGSGVIFSTHGIIDAGTPYLRQPALVLSNPIFTGELMQNHFEIDGYLTMSEIMNLQMPTEIVATLACETGIGEMIKGEGIMNLGRAFQYAGARSILISLWKVEDESTNILGERFFLGLKQGLPKDKALLEAKRYLKDQGYAHPLFWAGFVLIGERDQIPKKTDSAMILILCMSFILIIIMGYIWYKKMENSRKNCSHGY
jgi:CHAT domain-containing protein